MRTETVKLFILVSIFTILTGFTLGKSFEETEVHEPVVITQKIEVKSEPIIEPPKPVIDHKELECLALNIYHEGRSESQDGWLAIAHVTKNRLESKRFPNTYCGVVYQAVHSRWWKENHNRIVPVRHQCQFSWYCDGKSDRVHEVMVWKDIIVMAMLVMQGKTTDPTNGALYYYNPSLASPHWADAFEQVAFVDNHRFLR